MFLDVLVENLHTTLSRSDPAKEYLRSRNVTDEEVEEYRLGYSRVIAVPEENSKDRTSFMATSYKGRKFESKIIFPLYDINKRVTGLFGRAIDSKAFQDFLTEEAGHRGAFFGLYQALPYIYETGTVYVVEGPFDLLAFRKVYRNSVASLTAGLSKAQQNLLSFFAGKIITVFDSDKAGRMAAEEARESWGLDAVDLGFKDPDNCLKMLGIDKYRRYVQERVNRIVPSFLQRS